MPGYMLDNMPNYQEGSSPARPFRCRVTDQIAARVRGSSQIDGMPTMLPAV
ncbi:MAG: hypothetical protein R3C97_18305 [Geminicoccaceae bacterium]